MRRSKKIDKEKEENICKRKIILRWRVTTEKETEGKYHGEGTIVASGGRTDIKGSKRGPRGPKKCLSYKHWAI